jgi:aspartate/methionine/tyrosine aminotransferase
LQQYIATLHPGHFLNLSPSSRSAALARHAGKSHRYLESIPDLGAYSESQGIAVVRDEVAEFLEERDGHKADASNIFLTNGASEGVRHCMQMLLRTPADNGGKKDGILCPIPQYPLYSALTALLDGELVPYLLDEAKGWSTSVASLKAALDAARANGTCVRGLVVINPGNPTGQVLDEAGIRELVQFCMDEGIVLMADEVYQENIWRTGAKFVSFRKVRHLQCCSEYVM